MITISKRTRLRLVCAALVASAVLVTTGCGKANGQDTQGAVFAMTNVTADNRIVAYTRASDGSLTRNADSVSTRGLGIGVDLDTQGSLRLSRDNRFLYAVNAGSDDLTVFSVSGSTLTFVQRIAVGDQPVGLTLSGTLLYVLNGSVAGNGITGFRIAADGTLTPIANSFRALSSPIAVPGIVQFSPDGGLLLVTHKTANALLTPVNTIDAFTVGSDGLASAVPVANASVGIRPFSLAFRADGSVVVVEAFNAFAARSAASSYSVQATGSMTPVSRSIANGQTDACWIVVSPDQRYIYTANFGSGTISSYASASNGTLSLLNGQAASLGATSQPVDVGISGDGRYLYQLLRGSGGVAPFRIETDGSLTALGAAVIGGLPVADGASGLAVY